MEENYDKQYVHTIFGTKIPNYIVTDDGEMFRCITYASVKKVIMDKKGFFNVGWNEDIGEWIVMQYVLLDGTEGAHL